MMVNIMRTTADVDIDQPLPRAKHLVPDQIIDAERDLFRNFIGAETIIKPQRTRLPEGSVRLRDFPPQPEATTLSAQREILEESADIAERMGLIKPLVTHQPIGKANGRTAHVLTMTHPPEAHLQSIQTPPHIWNTQQELFRFLTILHRMGICTPLHHEGGTRNRQNILLPLEGGQQTIFDAESQEYLFDNAEAAKELMQKTTFGSPPRSMMFLDLLPPAIHFASAESFLSTANWQIFLQKHLPAFNLFRSPTPTRINREQLRACVAAVEFYDRFLQGIEEDFIRQVQFSPSNQLSRTVMGLAHRDRVVEILLKNGYEILVTEPQSIPADLKIPRPIEESSYLDAKASLARFPR